MKNRIYKGITSDAVEKQDNPTLDFFIKFVANDDNEFVTMKHDLIDFIHDGFTFEGRDIKLAMPNALGFLFVLETSGRKPKRDHIFDALESSISNKAISDEDVSRYAWGILRRIEGWSK
jgi:hypothetical protein